MGRDRMSGAPALGAAALLISAGMAQGAWAPPYYQLHRAGLFDAEHTAPDGTQYSAVAGMNASGRVVGISNRLANGYTTDTGAPEGEGTTAWTWTLADGTTRLGLSDGAHVSPSGASQSYIYGVNSSGQVTGNSTLYAGESLAGRSAWAWSAGSGHTRLGFSDTEHTLGDGSQDSDVRTQNDTGQVIGRSARSVGGASAWSWTQGSGSVRLGLVDSEHTDSAGVQSSSADYLNESGRVLGSSQRYGGSSGDSGSSAWTWAASNGLVRLGFIDAEHTSSEGRRLSRGISLSDSGRVIGFSERYTGATDPFLPGRSAWTWSEADGQVRIGFFGSEHTQSNGFQSSTPAAVNDTGRVVGSSARFNGAADAGMSAWTWTAGAGTVEIGLTDAGHTRNDGYRASSPVWLNSTDRVAGTATRFSGATELGVSTWTWSAGSGTVQIGLTDAAHTISGFQQNIPMAVSDSGHVAGTAQRPNSGQSLWVWSPATGNTVRTGLFNAQHTRTTGSMQRSEFLAMNDVGDVVGTSERFNGNTARGQSAWFFDADTTITHSLVFSSNAVGTAFTTPSILTDSGLVLGSYRLYTGLSAFTERGFIWSVENQFADLGTLVDGQLSNYGWQLLSLVADNAELAAIVGSGRALGGTSISSAVYVLTIPAPGAAASMLGFAFLASVRRRR